MLSRARIRSTTREERAARRQRVEDRKALHANLALVRAGGEPTVEPVQAVDEARKAFIRTLPCWPALYFGVADCRGIGQVEHQREGVAKGSLAPDPFTYSICAGHHEDRHDGRGVYAGLSLDEVRESVRAGIAWTDEQYAAHLASPPRATALAPTTSTT